MIARSLYAHATKVKMEMSALAQEMRVLRIYSLAASFSPLLCIRIHELYTIVPGLEAPVTVTEVPSGKDPELHPLVEVDSPVPLQ